MEMQDRAANAYEWLEASVFALCFTLFLLVFLFNFSRVSGSSMVPTLSDGDRVIVRTFLYTPQRGDVVTTDAWIDYGKPLAKRVIGVAGDVVDIDAATGEVCVNGAVLQEPYISAPTTTLYDVTFPYTVPEGTVFVMGDNRPGSLDSRSTRIGCIDTRDILGKILFCISPASHTGKVQ